MALAEHGFFPPEAANDFLVLDNLVAKGRLPAPQHQRRQPGGMLRPWFRIGAGTGAAGARNLATRRRETTSRWSLRPMVSPVSDLCSVRRRSLSSAPTSAPICLLACRCRLPKPTAYPRRTGRDCSREEVAGAALSRCKRWQFGPARIRPQCHAFDPDWVEVPAEGRISWERAWHPRASGAEGIALTWRCWWNCPMPVAFADGRATCWAIPCRRYASGPKFRACSSITRGFAAVHAAAVALPVTGSPSTDERQADIDLVVVGAGAGGMVAALVAAPKACASPRGLTTSRRHDGHFRRHALDPGQPARGGGGPCRLGPGGGQLPGTRGIGRTMGASCGRRS